MFPLTFLLFTLTNLAFSQISFSDPISSGTTCLPEVTPSGLQVTCTGKGFFILDPLLSQQTTINFQILSKTTEIGIGFGQRPDSYCFSTMFPVAGETWATCPPPSGSALNVPCNTNRCYFNKATAYTSSSFISSLGAFQTAHIQDLKKYQWSLQPPNCPFTGSKCWEIKLIEIPSTGSMMTLKIYSPSNLCDPVWYSYTCNAPSSYALYFELEGDGNAIFLFNPPSSSCPLLHCLSCPDSGHCQYCQQGYYVNLDKSTCTSTCPLLSVGIGIHCKCLPSAILDSSTATGASCVCDSSRHFTFNPVEAQCECMSGFSLDPSLATCLPLCWTVTAPNNLPPYCVLCHSSCDTCSGPDANQCLTCPSGYYLTPSETCEEIPKEIPKAAEEEDYELDSASKAAETGKTISTVGMIVSSAASVGSSEAVRTSLIGKMFKYLRYLDIAYPKNLRNLFHSKPSDFLSAKTGIKIPESLEDEESYDRAPGVYRRYVELPSSFFVNFWEDLLMLLILSGATLLVYFVDFFVKRGSQNVKKKSLMENISGKVCILVQSFLIIYMYKDGGDVVFFQILDFRTMNSYSGVEVLNPFASIIFLVITISLICFHYYIISRYQRIKSEKSNPKALDEYIEKKEKLQIFFKDYKDDGMTHQSFLLILVVRDVMYNFMLGLLFEYSLVQTILFPCYSLIMLVYIFIGRPFKRGLDNIQHFTYEILLFVVNICVMILAMMDSVGSVEISTRNNLGTAVIVINCLFNYAPTLFLVLKVSFLGYEFYQQRNKRNEPVKGEFKHGETSHINPHFDNNQTSMMELVKDKGNLDISQDNLYGGRGPQQIFYQENPPQVMNESYAMAENETGYFPTVNHTNNYSYNQGFNGHGILINENNENFQGVEEINMRYDEKVGNEGGDVIYGDVKERPGKVKAEPVRRRRIKLGN